LAQAAQNHNPYSALRCAGMVKCPRTFSYGNPGPGTAALLQCVRDELLTVHSTACSSPLGKAASRLCGEESEPEQQKNLAGARSHQGYRKISPCLGEETTVSRPVTVGQIDNQRRSSSVGAVRNIHSICNREMSLFDWPPTTLEQHCSLSPERKRVTTAPAPSSPVRRGAARSYESLAAAWGLCMAPGRGKAACSSAAATPTWLLSGVVDRSRSNGRTDQAECQEPQSLKPATRSSSTTRSGSRPRRVTFHQDCKLGSPTSLLSLCGSTSNATHVKSVATPTNCRPQADACDGEKENLCLRNAANTSCLQEP